MGNNYNKRQEDAHIANILEKIEEHKLSNEYIKINE